MTIVVPSPVTATSPAQGTSPGATVWFTGLPSAGKTTIARAVAEKLVAAGHRVEVLDGDVVRRELCSDLGYSREDREQNIGRIGYLATMLAGHGVIVLAAVIAPYATARKAVRQRHEQRGISYLEAYVATPVEVCSARDVKGLYAKQRAGVIHGLTGVDDVYEAPESPELELHTESMDLDDSVAMVLAGLSERGLV